MRKPAIWPVGSAAAPVNTEKLELGREADAVPLEVVVDPGNDRLGIIDGGAEEASGIELGGGGGGDDELG